MVSKPPGRNRPTSGGISVDLGHELRGLFRGLGFTFDQEHAVGPPGEYTGTARCADTTFGKAVTYLAEQVMSKFDDGEPSTDKLKTDRALAKFREAEELCKATNARFDRYFYGHRPESRDVTSAIEAAREKIWSLMGPLDLDAIAHGCAFTNGASVNLPRRRASSFHKYSSVVETTESAEHILESVFRTIPLWGKALPEGSRYSIVDGNKLTCVPKNYKVHRLIASEPSGLMYLQKGIHKFMRQRLKAVGVDLSNQVTNQDWARFGSATGLVATIDMSMASDTVATSLVEWLWPPEWFSVMDLVRSRFGILPSGEKILYRKFSSMGNAETFEVESAIFWALATACCKVVGADGRFVGVYGDDVVLPVRAVPLFLDVLKECGFVPNEAKSFVDGPFRESCGKHFQNGLDVSPFYIKKPIKRLTDLFLLANNLERWRRRVSLLDGYTEADETHLRASIQRLRDLAPLDWRRPRIPDGYGDGAFIGTFDECLPRRAAGRRLYFDGWQVEVLMERYDAVTHIVEDSNGEFRPVLYDRLASPWGGYVRSKRRIGKPDKSLKGLSLSGFLLDSLKRLEGRDPPWHISHSRWKVNAMLAKSARTKLDTESEASGVVLLDSRRTVPQQIVVRQF